MKKHWAPWRMNFILGPKERGCIFCRYPKYPRSKDRKYLVLYRGRHCFVILNKYPYNNGHLMVVPYRHLRHLEQMNAAEDAELMELCGITSKALKNTMHCQGLNLGMNLEAAGGAGIRGHLHMHVVPRWVGDTNFMPILADTKVLVEHLGTTYERLAPAIAKLKKKK